MAPFLAMAKLERVLFALGLPKELFHVVYLLAELLKTEIAVCEGGRCWSRLSLCYVYWDDCRANKG